jgi:hypothetical protein
MTGPARIKPKNGFIFAREVPEAETTTAGGIILRSDVIRVASDTGHEVEVVSSACEDLKPGDRVIIAVAGISAFHSFQAERGFSIPEHQVWAKVSPFGELLPRHGQILTERDDALMKRYAFGDSPLHLPESHLAHGLAGANPDDPQNDGRRSRDSVTVLYERVVRRGPSVKDDDLKPGAVVCFSPSYCSTRLQRLTRVGKRTEVRHYHLVDAGECFFTVEGA